MAMHGSALSMLVVAVGLMAVDIGTDLAVPDVAVFDVEHEKGCAAAKVGGQGLLVHGGDGNLHGISLKGLKGLKGWLGRGSRALVQWVHAEGSALDPQGLGHLLVGTTRREPQDGAPEKAWNLLGDAGIRG